MKPINLDELKLNQCMRCGKEFEIEEKFLTIELKDMFFDENNELNSENCDEYIQICSKCKEEIEEKLFKKWNEIKDTVNKELFDD